MWAFGDEKAIFIVKKAGKSLKECRL